MSHRVSSELLAYLHTKHCVNIRSPKGDTRWWTAAEIRIENNKKQQLSRQEKTDLAHVCMREAVFLLSEPSPWFVRPLPSTFSRICGFAPEVAT